MKLPLTPLTAISPIDGRYGERTSALRAYVSEYALMKYRCLIEIEYVIALSHEKKMKECKPTSRSHQKKLLEIIKNFSLQDAKAIKQFEKKTNHDVKAVEYFLREKFSTLGCSHLIPFLHFALTSEDINGIAYALMWRDAVKTVYLPAANLVRTLLSRQAKQWAAIPMISLTHGQSASPTTLGKELSVYAHRLSAALQLLEMHSYSAKMNGAVGTWAAHTIAYPSIDWMQFSSNFLRKMGLAPNLHTTQVESGDSLAASYVQLAAINSILLDLVRDMWLYCMRGVLQLKRLTHEVGSSTMPHKINPIHFENAEGNIGVANAQLFHLASTLPVSRMQRDLSGSTLIRTQGVALAHSLSACHTIISGLERISPNTDVLFAELNSHWEVLGEAIQTMLRKSGNADAYEIVKEKTRGITMTKDEYVRLVGTLPLKDYDRNTLQKLTPSAYIGYAKKLAKT